MKAIIGFKIEDGYLNFDPDSYGRHDKNLASWLENVAVEDLLRGSYHLDIEVEVTWDFDGAPIMEVVE